jgi:FKBP-type peptidyl-prolyl cis-trans isomerase FkpA
MPLLHRVRIALAVLAVTSATGATPAAADQAPTSKPAPATAAAPAAPATAAAPAAADSPIQAARHAAEAEGIVVKDLNVGHGTVALAGARVRVHYTGWLQDLAGTDAKGKQFDSSRTRGQPFSFQLGQRNVIRGWDLGVAGMQPGGKRRLVIPPAAGYGARGAGDVIPPNATLVFDVELIDVLPPS